MAHAALVQFRERPAAAAARRSARSCEFEWPAAPELDGVEAYCVSRQQMSVAERDARSSAVLRALGRSAMRTPPRPTPQPGCVCEGECESSVSSAWPKHAVGERGVGGGGHDAAAHDRSLLRAAQGPGGTRSLFFPAAAASRRPLRRAYRGQMVLGFLQHRGGAAGAAHRRCRRSGFSLPEKSRSGFQSFSSRAFSTVRYFMR